MVLENMKAFGLFKKGSLTVSIVIVAETITEVQARYPEDIFVSFEVKEICKYGICEECHKRELEERS